MARKSRRLFIAGAMAIGFGAVGVGVAATAAQQLPPAPRGPRGDRVRAPARAAQRSAPLVRSPGETAAQYRERVLDAAKPGHRTGDYARDTRGKPITVGGRTVALPADAYVEGLTTNVLCVPERPCPETPFYTIRRGKSWLNVAVRSGKILAEGPALGEEGAFNSLKEAFR